MRELERELQSLTSPVIESRLAPNNARPRRWEVDSRFLRRRITKVEHRAKCVRDTMKRLATATAGAVERGVGFVTVLPLRGVAAAIRFALLDLCKTLLRTQQELEKWAVYTEEVSACSAEADLLGGHAGRLQRAAFAPLVGRVLAAVPPDHDLSASALSVQGLVAALHQLGKRIDLPLETPAFLALGELKVAVLGLHAWLELLGTASKAHTVMNFMLAGMRHRRRD